MTLADLFSTLKMGQGHFGHAGRPGKRGGSAMGPLSGMTREVSFDGNYLEIQYTKMIPHPNHPEYMVADLNVGFPNIRGKVKGDILEIRAIGSGNMKRTGIGTAMVRDAMKVAKVDKISSTGVESKDGKAFLDSLASTGFQIVGRNL